MLNSHRPYSRWCNRKCNDRKELGDAYKSIALRWLRRQPRMKSCKLEDIDRMIRRTRSDDTVCFEIEAKGKTFYSPLLWLYKGYMR